MTKISLVLITLVGCVLSIIGEGNTYQNYTEYIELSDMFCITSEYPHNTSSFTQGLFFYNGELYETTGRYGESNIYKNIHVREGTFETQYSFDNTIFAEGSTVFEGVQYVLTYKENKVFTFNPETLEPTAVIDYPYEGWGLTTDNKYLIASDGTEIIRFFDKNLNIEKTIKVTLDGEGINRINELEFINGKIYANRWLTNDILIICPESGNVLKVIDASVLLKKQSEDINDVLNGIAYNPENGKLYLTGKRWDTLFELEFK